VDADPELFGNFHRVLLRQQQERQLRVLVSFFFFLILDMGYGMRWDGMDVCRFLRMGRDMVDDSPFFSSSSAYLARCCILLAFRSFHRSSPAQSVTICVKGYSTFLLLGAPKGQSCGLTHFLYFVVNGSIFGTVFYLFLLTSYPR
jgi:hypothetical protein